MSSSMNLSLTDELRRYVDSRTGDNGVYATPSEYLRDLIRRDMEAGRVVDHVMRGIQDMKNDQLSEQSILDIANEA